MILNFICKTGLGYIGELIGNSIVPGVGGEIGKQIGKGIGRVIGPEISDALYDPEACAEVIAYKADCIREYGFDPLDIW